MSLCWQHSPRLAASVVGQDWHPLLVFFAMASSGVSGKANIATTKPIPTPMMRHAKTTTKSPHFERDTLPDDTELKERKTKLNMTD